MKTANKMTMVGLVTRYVAVCAQTAVLDSRKQELYRELVSRVPSTPVAVAGYLLRKFYQPGKTYTVRRKPCWKLSISSSN
jgi:hypothetical protein